MKYEDYLHVRITDHGGTWMHDAFFPRSACEDSKEAQALVEALWDLASPIEKYRMELTRYTPGANKEE